MAVTHLDSCAFRGKPGRLEVLRERAAADFHALGVPALSEPEAVQQLREYGATINLRLQTVERHISRPQQSFQKLLSMLSEQELASGLEVLKDRLDRETHYLDEYRDVGLHPYILDAFPEELHGAVIKFFTDPECFHSKVITNKNASGAFHVKNNEIYIRGETPSLKEQWASIAATGCLPRVFGTVDHELTHQHQYYEPDDDGNQILLHPKRDTDLVLLETHAYDAMRSSPAFYHDRLNTRGDIARQVMRAAKSDDSYKVRMAYDLVHNLRLLGRDDSEIANIVAADHWDKREKTFPGLHQEYRELRDKNAQTNGAFAVFIKALRTKFDVEQHYQRYLASTIATEVLNGILGDQAAFG